MRNTRRPIRKLARARERDRSAWTSNHIIRAFAAGESPWSAEVVRASNEEWPDFYLPLPRPDGLSVWEAAKHRSDSPETDVTPPAA